MAGPAGAGLDPRLAARGIDRVEPFAVPLRTRFRRVDVRHGLLLRGPAGWGEWSPFPEYPPAVAARWLAAALEAATAPAPTALRDRIAVNVTVPAVAPEVAAALVAASGCRTAKVKVAEPGRAPAEDEARVAAVRAALGPDGAVRIDANGAWGVATARARLAALDEAAGGLEYAEQPCPTLADLAELRPTTSVRLAVDEPLRTEPSPDPAAVRAAADVAVLKVQPLGGTTAVLALAERLDLPVVVSSALDTSVGLAVGLRTAAALPSAPLDCGLGTAALLADDVAEPLLPHGGVLRTADAVDLAPDEARLVRLRPSDTVAADLGRRLTAALDALEARDRAAGGRA